MLWRPFVAIYIYYLAIYDLLFGFCLAEMSFS